MTQQENFKNMLDKLGWTVKTVSVMTGNTIRSIQTVTTSKTKFPRWLNFTLHVFERTLDQRDEFTLEFVEWLDNLPLTSKISVWSEDGASRGLYKKTNKQLLNNFKDEKGYN